MRTQEEILERIKFWEDDDFLGTKRRDLVEFLDFENAKQFLKDEVTESDWTKEVDPVACIKNYMEFAWDKANNCRGLSAWRSIEHMTAWIWLLGDEDLQKKFDETEYEHYGKEKLIVVCEHLGIDWEKYDDGIRTNTDE